MATLLRRLLPLAVWIAFITAWELFGRTTSVAKFLPPPSAIVMAGLEMLRSGELLRDVIASLRRVSLGYAVGVIAAIGTGIPIGRLSTKQ